MLFRSVAIAAKVLAFGLRLLLEPINIVGRAFEWFHNSIIVPIGNKFVDVINGVIDGLNHIPFVNIKKLDKLSLIGDAAEKMAAQMERQAEIIRGMYDRQIDKVKDQLSAQIDSLKSQYELGLITREDYNAQAEQYQQTADNEILKINEDMLLELAKINANTYAALTGSQQQQVENTQKATSYASTLSENWGNHTGVIGNIAGTVVGGIADVGVAVWDGITSAASTVSNWVSSWWPFASGTARAHV